MLTDLNIRNFAIIDRLHVAFGPGFNVLSGETGAGKSILLGAVGLLLGGRARIDDIRSGEEEASIEALFDLAATEVGHVRSLLDEAGIELEGNEILVRRTVSRSGKNRVFINGSLATVALLQPIAEQLVTIYGQHEHQSLLRGDTHLAALDDFAGHADLLQRYQEAYRQLQQSREQLRRLETGERERQQRRDLLSFQCQEIAAAQLREGEEDDLEGERRLLQNAEKLAAATQGGYERLYGEDGAASERIDQAATALEGLAQVDPRLGDLARELRTALYSLEDVASQLRGYGANLSFDPGRLDEVENRLASLKGLTRKYGGSVAEVLAYRDKIETELSQLTNVDAAKADIESEIRRFDEALAAFGAELSTRRRQAAALLETGVEKELADLAMPQARFRVVCQGLAEPGPAGMEKVEFHLAANPGEEPRPLARIASGGELSRIMLALRRATPGQEGVGTLIFDEVDAGIGGATATFVGEKLRSLAQNRQVLCVTHLPQVAAFADRQYLIAKKETEGRTRTGIQLLAEDARIQEMARMLGGARVTDRTLEHARELIHQSRGAA